MNFLNKTGFERFNIFLTNAGLNESSLLCQVPYNSYADSDGFSPKNSSYNAVPIYVSKVFINTPLEIFLL